MDRPIWVNKIAYVIAISMLVALPLAHSEDKVFTTPPSNVYGNPEFRHAGNILFMAPLENGSELLSLGNDGTIRVWDLGTRKESYRMAAPQYETFWGAHLLNDRKRVLTVTDDRGAILWDIEEKKPIKNFYFSSSVYRLTMLPNEKAFVTGSSNKRCYVWDVETGKVVRIFKGHNKSVYCVVAPDDKTVISCGSDGQVISWNVETGNVNWSQSPNAGDLFSLYLSPDRESVLVCSEKQGAKLRTVKTGDAIWTNGDMKDVRTAAWAHSGKHVALHNDKLIIVDATTGKTLRSMKKTKGYPWSVCWSLDDTRIFASTDGVIQEFNAVSGERLYPQKDIEINTSGTQPPLVFAKTDSLYIPDWNKSFELRRKDTWEPSGELKLPQDYRAISHSKNSGLLATISNKGSVQVIDALAAEHTQTFSVGSDYDSRDMEFSPDGVYLYISSQGRISRWHIATSTMEQTFPAIDLPPQPEPDRPDSVEIDVEVLEDDDDDFWFGGDPFGEYGEDEESLPSIKSMSISPDGALIAACLDDGSISIISSMDGTVLQSLIYPMRFNGFKSCCFVDAKPLALVAICSKRDVIIPDEPGLKPDDDDDEFGFDDDDGFGFGVNDDEPVIDNGNKTAAEQKEPVLPVFKEPSWTLGGVAVWQFKGSDTSLPDKTSLDQLFEKAVADSFEDRRAATDALIKIGLPLLEVLSGMHSDDPELLYRIKLVRKGILMKTKLNVVPTNFPDMDIKDLRPCPGTPNWVMISRTTPYESILYCRLQDESVTVEKRFSDTNLHGGLTVDDERIITGNRNGTFSVFDLSQTGDNSSGE